MASGILVLLFGEAKKLSSYVTLENKSYRAVVRLGRSTDTDDAQGKTLEELPEGSFVITPEALANALAAELVRTTQLPPRVSALRVGGQRAHALHRAGQTPALLPREVSLKKLALERFEPSRIELELTVSKGYYVRALARDLGAALGVPAHLEELRRIQSGSFGLDEAIPWPLEVPAPLLSLEAAARRILPALELSTDGERLARQGKRLSSSAFLRLDEANALSEPSAWFAPSGELVALGRRSEDGDFLVVRGFQPAKNQ